MILEYSNAFIRIFFWLRGANGYIEILERFVEVLCFYTALLIVFAVRKSGLLNILLGFFKDS